MFGFRVGLLVGLWTEAWLCTEGEHNKVLTVEHLGSGGTLFAQEARFADVVACSPVGDASRFKLSQAVELNWEGSVTGFTFSTFSPSPVFPESMLHALHSARHKLTDVN